MLYHIKRKRMQRITHSSSDELARDLAPIQPAWWSTHSHSLLPFIVTTSLNP